MDNDKSDKKELDQFEKKLLEEIEIIKNCQKNNSTDSCLKCEKIIGCDIRNSYVKAVYDSMNKGQSGGFEF